MKKRGFTLIELLAVIVILAIIALIATPIVMNTIEKSKKSAAERSADNYIDAVETAVATKRLDGVILDDGVYSIKENGNICIDKTTTCTDDTEVKVEINGTKPASGSKVALTNGQVVATGTSLLIDGYTVAYNSDNKLIATTGSSEIICEAATSIATGVVTTNGDFGYEYNNENIGLLATAGHEYDSGVTYKCTPGDGITRTFFVLSSTTNEVSLIMDRNFTDDMVPTGMPACQNESASADDIESGNYECVTYGLDPYINHIQGLWNKVTVGVPTAPQIAAIDGVNYQGSPQLTSTWLYANNDNHYWAAPLTDTGYFVTADGIIESSDARAPFGLRPIITISKSQLG